MSEGKRMNPYRILKIKKSATKEEIKIAYREMSKKHHPDTGGSVEEFHKLKAAYDILMDDLKREFYDKNGIMPDSEDAKIFAVALDNLVDLLNHVMENYRSNNLEKVDLIKVMSNNIKRDISNNKSIIEKHKKEIEKIENTEAIFKKRVKKKPRSKVPNFFLDSLKFKKGHINAEIKKHEEALKILNKMQSLLFNFTYENDEDEQPCFSRTILVNTTTTSGM
jgi:curved DNA-binding protein CbpA